jgi:hypothetical protein
VTKSSRTATIDKQQQQLQRKQQQRQQWQWSVRHLLAAGSPPFAPLHKQQKKKQ